VFASVTKLKGPTHGMLWGGVLPREWSRIWINRGAAPRLAPVVENVCRFARQARYSRKENPLLRWQSDASFSHTWNWCDNKRN